MFGIKRKNQQELPDVRLLPAKEKARYDWKAAAAKAAFVFLLVYGSIGGFLSAYEMDYQREQCILGIFLLSLLLSAVYETKRKWAVNLVNILVFVLYVYVAFRRFWVINSGYYAIINRILDDAGSYLGVTGRTEYGLVVENESAAVTGFALFLGMVGTILLQMRLHHKASLWTTILLTLPLYVIPFYFEKTPGTGYMILLFTGYAAAVLQGADARETMSGQARDILLPVLFAVAVFVQLTALLLPYEGYASLVRASAAKKASERQMADIVQFGLPAMFGQGRNGAGVSGGLLSKGYSVMPDYETDLIVRYTPYDYEPVYLKAFTGKDYMGDRWTAWRMMTPVWSRRSRQGQSIMCRAIRTEPVWDGNITSFTPWPERKSLRRISGQRKGQRLTALCRNRAAALWRLIIPARPPCTSTFPIIPELCGAAA